MWEHLNIQQTLTDVKGETDSYTIVVGDVNTQLTSIIQAENQGNIGLDQMDLRDVYRTFYSKQQTTILFKCICNIFQDRIHVSSQNKSQ